LRKIQTQKAKITAESHDFNALSKTITLLYSKEQIGISHKTGTIITEATIQVFSLYIMGV